MSGQLLKTAHALIQGNKLEQARQVLFSILEDDPKSIEALKTLAAIEVREGKYLSGIEFLDEVLRIDPSNADVLQEKKRIQDKLNNPSAQEPDHGSSQAKLLDAVAPLERPKFSIIIPVYNQVEYTKQCIKAVWATCKEQNYEIIVVDDCSTDGTQEFLESVKDCVRSFRNEKNQGFILNCNFAASQSRGEYIVLLNNDTIPQEHWLEALLEPFHLFEKVAATGALMIHPNNKILEACSIVFSDGSGWNYGRGEDPDLPKYNFIREVDYVSGGGMMVPKKIWDEMHGLDTYYCPAYYDDIDFCFRARQKGYKVLYTPFSRIIHFEGMSGGTDVTKGVKRYQVVNQGKFKERWKDELKNQYENKYENVFKAARRGSGKRVLWIDHCLPFPNFNSGCLRMNNLLKSMVKLGHKITYVSLSNSDPDNYKQELRKMGVETHSLNYELWENSRDREAIVEQALDMLEVYRDNYDIVYLSFYWVATLFIKKIRRRLPSAIVYVDSHDIHFLRVKREAELYKDPAYHVRAEQTRIHELSVYARADAVMAVTELDRQAVLKELPNAVVLLMPNVHDVVPPERGFHERRDLLFVGGFNHTPNVDAMVYFCGKIFPKVKQAIPDIKLWIVGSNPTPEVKTLANDSVIVTGWVKETKPYLDQSRISIAPLRYGAGMKGKVGEAMSHGLPVITTSVGSEGMGIVPSEHALVIETPDEWVNQIVRLYQDESLWKQLSANGQELMRRQYGSEEMLRRAKYITDFHSRADVAALSACPSKSTFTYANGLTSIVILTYNQLDYTKECVKSIQAHTPEPHEIIFIDNGSTDQTVKWLRRLVRENQNYTLIENPRNYGFAKGCNQGIEASSGEYVLLLNNDVVVTKDWLSGMIECVLSAPDIGIVGPMTNNISGPQKVPVVGYTDVKGLATYSAEFRARNRHRKVAFRRIVGFCMLFRRDLADTVGMLDECFGTGNFEDDDYCLRADLLGYRNVIAGDVFIHHYGSRSFLGNRMNYASVMTGNRKYFTRKWSNIDAQSEIGKRLASVNNRDKAMDLDHEGKLEQAVAALLEGIRRTPEARPLYYALAEMLLNAKQYNDALNVLTELLPDDDDERRLALAGYCADGLGRSDEAERFARRALALNASSALALNLLGMLAYKNSPDAAKEWFEKAAAIDPGYADPWTNLGILKWTAGKEKKEALDLLERGFVLAPTVNDNRSAFYTAAAELGELARLQEDLREARALFPLNRALLFLRIDALIKAEQFAVAMDEIEQAMAFFGVDDNILSVALEIRNTVGPMQISADGKQKGTLSLCMIAKNEEKNLFKCLMSVKALVDEIILVDTGSTDKTKDIATALGAKVYDCPWNGDFSEARNTSLANASGDWILVLDADEVISPLDHDKIQKIVTKKGNKKAAYSLLTRNYVNESSVAGWVPNEGKYVSEEAGTGWSGSIKVRLFPRDSRIRFVNPVHELVEPTLKEIGMPVQKSDITIHHYGKLDAEKGLAKAEKYYHLGKKKLAETGETVDALKELAIQAGELGKLEEALDLWKRLLQLEPGMAAAYMNISSLCLKLDRYPDALEAARKAATLAPEMREAVYGVALCELYAGNPHDAATVLDALLRREPNYPPAQVLQAMSYCCNGGKERGIKLLAKLQSRNFDVPGSLYLAIKKLFSAGQQTCASLLLEAAQESGNMNADLLNLEKETRRQAV